MKKLFFCTAILFAVTSYSQMKMSENGNIGIGANPTADQKLKVNGKSYFYGGEVTFNSKAIFTDQLEVIFPYFPNERIKISGSAITADLQGIPGEEAGSLGLPTQQWSTIYGANIYTNGVRLTSDIRLKENIRQLKDPYTKLVQLHPVMFDYKEENLELNDSIFPLMGRKAITSKNRVGFIAQEVASVIPEIVSYDSANDIHYIDYIAIIPYLVESFKEQNTLIISLEQEKSNLRNEVVSLETRISILEARIDEYTQKCCTSDLGTTQKSATSNTTEAIRPIELYQNTPNPFSEQTTIGYFLPENVTAAMINIYDMNGNQIHSYPLQQHGESYISINGNELYAGIYLYTLIANGKIIETKQMVLTD